METFKGADFIVQTLPTVIFAPGARQDLKADFCFNFRKNLPRDFRFDTWFYCDNVTGSETDLMQVPG